MSIINNLIINMPIKWYGNGDLEDPIYKHFSRIVNFVIHCMIFTAIVSGTWLLKEIKYEGRNEHLRSQLRVCAVEFSHSEVTSHLFACRIYK